MHSAYNIAEPLRKKVIEYFVKQSPDLAQQVLTALACGAVFIRNTDKYKSVFPYISFENYPQLLRATIDRRNKTVLKQLLQTPNSSQWFNKALKGLEPIKQQWALDVFAQVQNTKLSKALVDKKSTRPPVKAKRKM